MPEYVDSLVRTPASHISVLKFSRQSCSRNRWNKITKVSYLLALRERRHTVFFFGDGVGRRWSGSNSPFPLASMSTLDKLLGPFSLTAPEGLALLKTQLGFHNKSTL
jgi:hypothetical protein